MTLKELRSALRITWDDEDSDSRLSGILERGKGILSSYAGRELAYDDTQPFEKQLLIELCRYIDNEALEKMYNAAITENVKVCGAFRSIDIKGKIEKATGRDIGTE